MFLADAFEPLRVALERAGIRFAVGGSWASTAFGEARFTNDVDILADVTEENLERFIAYCPILSTWIGKTLGRRSAVVDHSTLSICRPRSSSIYFLQPPLCWACRSWTARFSWPRPSSRTRPAHFVTPEDILLAKLCWFRSAAKTPETQWRDIQGVLRACAATLDREYLQNSAAKIGVRDLLDRTLN